MISEAVASPTYWSPFVRKYSHPENRNSLGSYSFFNDVYSGARTSFSDFIVNRLFKEALLVRQ